MLLTNKHHSAELIITVGHRSNGRHKQLCGRSSSNRSDIVTVCVAWVASSILLYIAYSTAGGQWSLLALQFLNTHLTDPPFVCIGICGVTVVAGHGGSVTKQCTSKSSMVKTISYFCILHGGYSGCMSESALLGCFAVLNQPVNPLCKAKSKSIHEFIELYVHVCPPNW